MEPITLCVVGCLVKPVCFSKYCDIKRLPSTAALLAIPVGLHRARQGAAYLTPTSLIPILASEFFATWKRRRLKQSIHCTAEKLVQRLMFLLFLLLRHERWSNNSNARPVPTASYLCLSHVYTDVRQFLFNYIINKPTTLSHLLHPSACIGLSVKSQRDVAS